MSLERRLVTFLAIAGCLIAVCDGWAQDAAQLRARPRRAKVLLEGDPTAKALVERLDFERFKSNIETLAGFGSRAWNQPGNVHAGDWIEAQLRSYGYEARRHTYRYTHRPRRRRGSDEPPPEPLPPVNMDNFYATKIGAKHPDRMYIVSAHMDSFNTQSPGSEFAPGANDDGSGTALVLEAARVFGSPDVRTDISIRFILWNNEETGLNGSRAYAASRRDIQGKEYVFPSQERYPEPTWLGIIQHDMILFDHGLPVQPGQRRDADVDIEFQAAHTYGGEAIALASKLQMANAKYATDYYAQVGMRMSNTDSAAFQEFCPAVSIRENERLAEIGRGSDPNWHKNSDVYETYSEEDFRLGFNALQMTVGAVAELTGAALEAD